MPMMYNPAGGAQRAGGNPSPSNNRQTNLRRIDDAARRRRQDRRPAQGRSPALPGVPQLPVAGLAEQPQQAQRAQQPRQQSQQSYNPSADYSQVPQGAQTLMPAGGQQQQSPAQQSAQQQQQGQVQLPSEVGGAMGQMIPRGGGGFPGGAQIPQGGQSPMLPQQEGTPSGPGMQTPMGGGTGGSGFPGQEIDPSMDPITAQTGGGVRVDMGMGSGAIQPLPGGQRQDPTAPKVGEFPSDPFGTGAADGAAGEAGTGAPGEAGGDPYADERSQYDALIEQAKADEQAAMQGIDADIARAQRRQAEMNAAMGGAVGGGLMGGMATTATLGARERAEAQVSAQEKTRNLQLGWLDRQLELKERDINRKFSREMSDKDKAHQLELEAARMDIELSPEFQEALDNGDYDEAMRIHGEQSGGAGGAGGSTDASTLQVTDPKGKVVERYEAGNAGSIAGSEGYDDDDLEMIGGNGDTQNWSYGEDGYVNGAVMGQALSDLLRSRDLPLDALSPVTIGNGPESQGGLRFSGGSEEGREFMAWASWFTKHTGKQPDTGDMMEKLWELGVRGIGRPGSITRDEYDEWAEANPVQDEGGYGYEAEHTGGTQSEARQSDRPQVPQ